MAVQETIILNAVFSNHRLTAGSAGGGKAAPAQESARWRGGRQSWVLLPSGLEGPQRKALHNFAAASGARVAATWQPGVTHVICHLDEKKTAKCVSGHAAPHVTHLRLLLPE